MNSIPYGKNTWMQPMSITRKMDRILYGRKVFSEGDLIHDSVILEGESGPLESYSVFRVTWEIFSFDLNELVDIMFWGSIHFGFLNTNLSPMPLLNTKPGPTTKDAFKSIIESADVEEELNRAMSSKMNCYGEIYSMVGCFVFKSVPLLIPPRSNYCIKMSVKDSNYILKNSLRVAIQLETQVQSVLEVG